MEGGMDIPGQVSGIRWHLEGSGSPAAPLYWHIPGVMASPQEQMNDPLRREEGRMVPKRGFVQGLSGKTSFVTDFVGSTGT